MKGRTKRQQEKASKRASRKSQSTKAPGGESVYARKRRGDYPLNSPYRTIWAQFA